MKLSVFVFFFLCCSSMLCSMDEQKTYLHVHPYSEMNPYSPTDEHTLHYKVGYGRYNEVAELLQNQKELPNQRNKGGVTPLCSAQSNAKMTELLLQYGAEPNQYFTNYVDLGAHLPLPLDSVVRSIRLFGPNSRSIEERKKVIRLFLQCGADLSCVHPGTRDYIESNNLTQ